MTTSAPHVGHVIADLSGQSGGPAAVALALGTHQRMSQLRVTWWATSAAGAVPSDALPEGVHLFPRSLLDAWAFAPRLRRTLQAALPQIDLLHLHQVWDYPLYAAAGMARQFRVPYLVTPHGIFSQRWRYASPKKALYLRLFARPLLTRAACIHAVTPAEISGLRDAGIRAPVAVVPNGVDPVLFAELPAPAEAEAHWPELAGKQVVLYLGRLSPEKGIVPLLRAWQEVQRERRAAVLMLAGDGEPHYLQRLQRLVSELGVLETVLMPGMLTGRRKLTALSRADLFVLPSYSEGSSLALLEALAFGKPCVITSGCNFPEVAAIGAGEVVELTPSNLALAIEEVLSLSVAQRIAMGRQGRELVLQQYTLDRAARRLWTVYRCILEGAPIPLYPEAWQGGWLGGRE